MADDESLELFAESQYNATVSSISYQRMNKKAVCENHRCLVAIVGMLIICLAVSISSVALIFSFSKQQHAETSQEIQQRINHVFKELNKTRLEMEGSGISHEIDHHYSNVSFEEFKQVVYLQLEELHSTLRQRNDQSIALEQKTNSSISNLSTKIEQLTHNSTLLYANLERVILQQNKNASENLHQLASYAHRQNQDVNRMLQQLGQQLSENKETLNGAISNLNSRLDTVNQSARSQLYTVRHQVDQTIQRLSQLLTLHQQHANYSVLSLTGAMRNLNSKTSTVFLTLRAKLKLRNNY